MVVTTSTLVRRLPSTGSPPRVRRLVSSPPGGRVSCGVPRRPRSKAVGLFLGHRDGVYRVASFSSSTESTRAFHDSQPRAALRRRRRREKSVMTAGLLEVLIGPKRTWGVTVLLECQMNDQTLEVSWVLGVAALGYCFSTTFPLSCVSCISDDGGGPRCSKLGW